MQSHESAAEISCRFGQDRIDIFEYINFMRDQCAVHIDEVGELNLVLARFGANTLPVRESLGIDHHLTPGEISELVIAIDRIEPAIARLSHDLDKRMDNVQTFQDGEDIENYHQLIYEWTSYAVEHLPDDPRESGYESEESALLERVLNSGEIQDNMSSKERHLVVEEALRKARYAKLRNLLYSLRRVIDRFKAIKSIAKMVGPDAMVGTLRQGFILLMTAFDAAIFDLVRYKLQNKFFDLVENLGTSDKISLQDIAKAGSMDAVRDKIIEEQLKKRYIKDLLKLLNNEWKVPIVPKGKKFESLLELILRRNLHVHNRGIVDKRYVSEGINLYDLNLGEPASIDLEYWQTAVELCDYCVHHVGAWACS